MAAKATTGLYYIVNTGAPNTVSVGPSYASQTPIANVVNWRLYLRQHPNDQAMVQVQLEVVVYDTVSNAAIARQAPQVIPNGYTDFKGLPPLKYIRTRAADVVCVTVNGGPGANQGDFYVTDTGIDFGHSGDAVLVGTNT